MCLSYYSRFPGCQSGVQRVSHKVPAVYRELSPRTKEVPVYTIEDGAIMVPAQDFAVRATLECGQVFRYAPPDHGRWELIAGDRRCELHERGNYTVIMARRRDIPYFVRYFDLDRSYAAMLQELRAAEPAALTQAAAAYGRGIRILRQEPFETLISFLISTNNNIKRIQGIIERLCAALGKPLRGNGTFRYAFPEPEAMASAGEMFYRDSGCGYRAPWIVDAAEKAVRSTELGRPSVTGAYRRAANVQGYRPQGRRLCCTLCLRPL